MMLPYDLGIAALAVCIFVLWRRLAALERAYRAHEHGWLRTGPPGQWGR